MSLTPSFDQYSDFTPVQYKTSLSEVAGASFKLGSFESETQSIGRFVQKANTGGENDIVSPEQANEFYPKLEKPITERTSLAKVALMDAYREERHELQKTIDMGGDDLVTKGVSFISSLGGASIDPIGLISGKLIGAGIAASSFARRAMAKGILNQSTATGRVLKEGVEGLIGNVASEGLINIPIGLDEHRDIEVDKALIFAAGSGFIGGAGLKSIGEFYTKLKTKSLNIDTVDKLISVHEQKIATGKVPILSDTEVELATASTGIELNNKMGVVSAEVDALKTEMNGDIPPNRLNALTEEFNTKKQELDSLSDEMSEYKEKYSNQEEFRKEANAPERDLYYDEESKLQYDAIERGEFASAPKDEFELELDEIRNDPDIDEDVKAMLEQDDEVFRVFETKRDEIVKAARKCLTGS